jgi:LDH2 family malate/lactate/ureidoglycolate dehydrogenase
VASIQEYGSISEPVAVRCNWRELRRFAQAVLQAVGTPVDDADYMAGQIVDSDLAGHESHGMRRLAEYVQRAQEGLAAPSASPVVDLDSGALVRIDGRSGFGHLVMRDAIRIAVERARVHGISAVAVRRSEWAGRLAPFCEEAAEAGVATLVFVNDSGSGQSVTVPGGREPRLSTNPIAAGVPRASSPHLVLDMATSSVAAGRLSEERDRGGAIPAEWLNDHGSLRPFGGINGFALALLAEALAGALTSAGTVSAEPAEDQQGALIIAIDVTQLRPLADFTAEIESFARYVVDTPLEPGASPIRLPGEGSAASADRRRATGVPVGAFTWQILLQLADEHGVPPPEGVPITDGHLTF